MMETNETHFSDIHETGELKPWMYVIIGVYLLLTGIFGTVGNSLALIMFISEKSFRTSVDMLLMNLAAADVAMTVCCFPFVASSNFAGRWLYGDIGCQLYGFLGYLFGCAALLSSCAISVERYLVICRKYSVSVSRKRVFMIKAIASTWIQSLVWSVIPFITGTNYHKEPFLTSCTINWYSHKLQDRIYIAVMVSMVALCIIIMCFCYVQIMCVTRKETIISLRVKRDRVLTKVCFTLVVVFVVCWMPYALFSLCYTFGHPQGIPLWVTAVPVMTAKLSCCVNPVLYLIVSKKFRERYLKVIRCNKTNQVIPGEINLATISNNVS